MQPDLESLRHHYAALSDEGLLAIKRADLVESAQPVYDQEVQQRKLAKKRAPAPQRTEEEKRAAHRDPLPPGVEPPDWIDEGTEVFQPRSFSGDNSQYETDERRAALEAAGIPCFAEFTETEYGAEPAGKYLEWKLLVPGNHNFEALSIIERDVENNNFEADWINHLEVLSDEELRTASPQRAFCGLFDKIERVTRAYDHELELRRMKANAA